MLKESLRQYIDSINLSFSPFSQEMTAPSFSIFVGIPDYEPEEIVF